MDLSLHHSIYQERVARRANRCREKLRSTMATGPDHAQRDVKGENRISNLHLTGAQH